MSGQQQFEDMFNHDPNKEYELEEEIDLGPDEEFADKNKTKQNKQTAKKIKKEKKPFSFKRFILIAVCYAILALILVAFFVDPKTLKDLEQKILPTLEKHITPIAENATKKVSFSNNLPQSKAYGKLGDLQTAMKTNPLLKEKVSNLMTQQLATSDTFHNQVKEIIYLWAGVSPSLDAEKQILEIIQAPAESDPTKYWNAFVKSVQYDLFTQTILKNSGVQVTYDQNTNQISFDKHPIEIMAIFYPKLVSLLKQKKQTIDQLKTIEPASSFFVDACKKEPECLASYDMMMESFGFQKYLPVLQYAPEKIYQP